MTRTALKRNGLAELRMRYARQGAKAPSNQRSQEWLQNIKNLEKLLTYSKIESEKERMVQHHEEIQRLIDETGHGLDIYEITEARKVDKNDQKLYHEHRRKRKSRAALQSKGIRLP